ncbi:Fic family protein [uncultured Rikenella sp.]|uniref:Fic family protein n=2 Tax=uncultured Rikenella sp. TaxID=368003 RepID=UPI00351D7F42
MNKFIALQTMNTRPNLSQIDTLKTELDALRPLPEATVRSLNEAMSIEYTYDSNRIEGNTLTLQETALVINEGITISGKSLREHLEVINHIEAVEFIEEVASQELPITESVIRDIHAIVLNKIDKENAGRYRTVPVFISGSKYTPPQPYLIAPQMEAFLAEYGRMEAEKQHPVLIAAYLHDELVRIHPFIDGNGRTSRLLMNLYLVRHGYPIVSLKGDNDSRVRYYNALEKSHITGDRSDFNTLIVSVMTDTLKHYLSIIRG